jgi:PRTRC genetic system protein B
MQVTTQIGNNHDFQLKQAILIYEDQISRWAKFATVHRVSNRIRGNPRRWPGNSTHCSLLAHLLHGLQKPAPAVLLPESVLAYTSDLLVWWTPPRLHRMFFSGGAEDRRTISGETGPHPPLIWKVYRGCLFLRALEKPTRPNAETKLMVAPY